MNTQDPLDQLLDNAFDQALDSMQNPDLVNIVMKRIRRQEHQRLLVMSLAVLLAGIVGVSISQPLLDLLTSAFSGISGAITSLAGHHTLSVSVLAVILVLLGTWLSVEEPI